MLYLSIIDSISHMRYDMSDRNWKEYNEALVRRGEILLDMEFLDNWSKELKIMNRGKEGARFIQISRVFYKITCYNTLFYYHIDS